MNNHVRSSPGTLGSFLRANPELPILAAAGLAALFGRRTILRRTAFRFADVASSAVDNVSDSARGLTESAEHAKMHFIQGAQVLTNLPVRETVGRLSGDPLALAAAGLAVGAALGVLTPGTRAEDSLLGEFRQKAQKIALEALDRQAERLKVAAVAAREQLREEIAEHGLNAQGIETMAKHVAQAAKDSAAHSAEPGSTGQPQDARRQENGQENGRENGDV